MKRHIAVAPSPTFGERLRQAAPAGLEQNFPEVRGDIKHVFADGDFVILHVHAKRKPDEPGLAIVDIFRLEAGKIVER